ncbi:hypothetical protein BaRGS_00001238 [Batillaria attramentaria]|uniref:Uncharacterized protein n=1 Tax=Batillaria attramentaria TaxID=370345 RepID=A0ABD0M7W3_9CAEN
MGLQLTAIQIRAGNKIISSTRQEMKQAQDQIPADGSPGTNCQYAPVRQSYDLPCRVPTNCIVCKPFLFPPVFSPPDNGTSVRDIIASLIYTTGHCYTISGMRDVCNVRAMS